MTVQNAIDMADALRPNTIPEPIKAGWLATLDGMLRDGVVAQHQPQGTPTIGTGADVDASPLTELLAQEPYQQMYQYWLCAQIDFALGEIARYSNSMALYNSALDAFTAAYKQGHIPVERGQFRV